MHQNLHNTGTLPAVTCFPIGTALHTVVTQLCLVPPFCVFVSRSYPVPHCGEQAKLRRASPWSIFYTVLQNYLSSVRWMFRLNSFGTFGRPRATVRLCMNAFWLNLTSAAIALPYTTSDWIPISIVGSVFVKEAQTFWIFLTIITDILTKLVATGAFVFIVYCGVIFPLTSLQPVPVAARSNV